MNLLKMNINMNKLTKALKIYKYFKKVIESYKLCIVT